MVEVPPSHLEAEAGAGQGSAGGRPEAAGGPRLKRDRREDLMEDGTGRKEEEEGLEADGGWGGEGGCDQFQKVPNK